MRSFFLFVILILPVAAGSAEPKQSRERSVGADYFAAGANVGLFGPVKGDLFAAGGNLNVDAAVGGDAVIAGGNVRVGATVAQNLYLAGGRVSVGGAVARNARIAGGHVEIEPRARIEGNASVAGGDLRIGAPIGGYLQVAGGHVVIDSAIAGDVEAAGANIELGPNARIGGKLRYASRDELKQDAAARVAGGIERIALPERAREAPEARPRVARSLAWIWSAGLVLLAAILAAALPSVYTGTATMLRSRWGWSLLIGFIVLVCTPVAALIAMVTVIGLPLALAALALYFALLLVGYVSTGASIGIAALQRWQPARATHRGWLFLFAALGMLLVCLLAAIPWIGGLFALAALLLGTGLLLQRLRPSSSS